MTQSDRMIKNVDKYLKNVSKTIDELHRGDVAQLAQDILDTYEKGGIVYFIGNGGSAATASHLAGDIVKGLSLGQSKRFKAMCFSDNSAAMMAIANDISYDDVFLEQLKNFMGKDDLVVGISGSGNSENVLRAIAYAKEHGVKTFGLCGYDGGKLKLLADHYVHADINDMEVNEDVHLAIGHCIKHVIAYEIDRQV